GHYRARIAAIDAIPPGPFLAIDAAAWGWLADRPVIVSPADSVELGVCVASRYRATSVVLEPAHFSAYDALYRSATSPALESPVASFFLGRVSRAMGTPVIAALVVVVWTIALAKTRWTDRPAIFGLVLFVVVLDLLFHARAGSRRALFALPPLVLLWANLHGSYPLGIGLVLAFSLEAVLVRRADAPRFLAALVACIVLSFLDPDTLGIGGAASHAFTPPRF